MISKRRLREQNAVLLTQNRLLRIELEKAGYREHPALGWIKVRDTPADRLVATVADAIKDADDDRSGYLTALDIAIDAVSDFTYIPDTKEEK